MVYKTPEIMLKQILHNNLSPFWPFDVILTPEIALFEHFEQIFADFGFLSTMTWELSHKTIVEIVNNTSEIMLKQISP